MLSPLPAPDDVDAFILWTRATSRTARGALFLCFVAVLLGAVMASVGAATLTVINTNDSGPGSLRQALADANDGDTIQFDPTLKGQTISLTSGELVIDKSIAITGPGPNLLAVMRQGSSFFRIVHVFGHTVMIQGLTIIRGFADSSDGGGIYIEQATLTISNCFVRNNFANGHGGGIFGGGTLTIIDSKVEFNQAGFEFGFPTGFGGGISVGGTVMITNSTIGGNTAEFWGGGIEFGGGTLTIFDSTISGNHAGTGNVKPNWGGGITTNVGGALIISNSTISENTSGKSSGIGGGIFSRAMLTISNSTISNNRASSSGCIYNGNGGLLDIANTILNVGVSSSNIVNDGGTITSHGYNLCSDAGGGFLNAIGDQINTDPLLGPLQDNGGPTFTHELLTGSPAINAGDPNFTPPPLYDQRGYARVYSGRIDIGSFEVQPAPTPSATPSPTLTPTPATPTPTATPTPSPTPTCDSRDPPCFDVGVFMTDSPDPVEVGRNLTYSITVSGNGVGVGWPVHMTDRLPAGVNFVSVLTSEGTCTGTSTISCDLFLSSTGAAAFPGIVTARVTLVVAPTATGTLSNTAVIVPASGDINPSDDSYTETTTVIPATSPTPTPAAQALNLSTRMRVLTGDNVGIGGFIITGTAPKRVILRGIGPSLTAFGVPDALADPVLELHGPAGFTTIINDNWMDDPAQKALIIASGLAPTDNLESAIVATLNPGNYTAIVKGKNNTTGVGLVEVYDLNQAAASKLANLSTRAFVSTGDDIVIAGFILGGINRVILRGIGPSLAAVGVPNALADPKLELRNQSGTLIRANDNWMDDPAQKALIIGAGLAPTNMLESAIAEDLPPGLYTALLSGVNSGTGNGLVEVYDLGVEGCYCSPTPAPTPTATATATAGGTPPPPSPTPSASPSPSAGPCVENFDGVVAPALPPGWVASNPIPGNGIMWVTTTVAPDSPPNDAFIDDQDGIGDKVLDRTGVMVTSTSPMMSFRNNFNTAMNMGIFWDGYVLEVSAPNISGGAFLDITDSHIRGSFVSGGYTGVIDSTAMNPLAGRMAWSGNSGGYINTVINMGPNLAGQTVTLRFRMGTDEGFGGTGVHIDNISITGASCP